LQRVGYFPQQRIVGVLTPYRINIPAFRYDLGVRDRPFSENPIKSAVARPSGPGQLYDVRQIIANSPKIFRLDTLIGIDFLQCLAEFAAVCGRAFDPSIDSAFRLDARRAFGTALIARMSGAVSLNNCRVRSRLTDRPANGANVGRCGELIRLLSEERHRNEHGHLVMVPAPFKLNIDMADLRKMAPQRIEESRIDHSSFSCVISFSTNCCNSLTGKDEAALCNCTDV